MNVYGECEFQTNDHSVKTMTFMAYFLTLLVTAGIDEHFDITFVYVE